MDKISTAEELLDKKFPEFEDLDNGNIWTNIEETMIEFAKLHVKAALKKVSEKAAININGFIQDYDENLCVDKNSILTSYPLKNIK
jgi:hypothetical protein